MTATELFAALIAAPLLGVLAARLLGHTKAVPILLGALAGEALAVAALVFWSRWLLRRALQSDASMLVALAPDVSLSARLASFGVIALLALVVGGLALVVLRSVGGRAS